MKKNNIVFSGKNKVIDIENIELDKLYEIEDSLKDRMKNLRKSSNTNDKVGGFLVFMAFVQSIRTIASVILHNNGFIDAAKTLLIAEGIYVSMPILYERITTTVLDKKMNTTREEYSRVQKEISNRYKKTIESGKKKDKLEKLEELKKELTEIEKLSKYKQSLKDSLIEYLINNNADQDIINMPGIQKIFDIAILSEENTMGNRIYNWNKPNEDGTFTISTHMKYPYGCTAVDYPKTYKIRYSTDENDDHYLEVTYNNQIIYINREGLITSIESIINNNLEQEKVLVK